MAWNEPGNKNPWGNKNDQGPPDLDEVFKKIQQSIAGLFGGGGAGGSSDGGSGSFVFIVIATFIVAIFWGLSGIYTVDAGTRAVVLRFGELNRVSSPGLHWHIPWPVEHKEIVEVSKEKSIDIGNQTSKGRLSSNEYLILTQDENIIAVSLAVQYQIDELVPSNYLFSLSDPEHTIKQVAESALREVVGKETMDYVLKEGRESVAAEVKETLKKTLAEYNSGIVINHAKLVDAQPPAPVQEAFADAIKAREDKERYINEAQAYGNQVLPQARGESARVREEAEAYKQQVISKAVGEAARFESLLTEYQLAPEITRKRLYLDTMEAVLQNSSKVVVDVNKGNNLMYLPLDKIAGAAAAANDSMSKPIQYDRTPVIDTKRSPVGSSGGTGRTISDARSRDRGAR